MYSKVKDEDKSHYSVQNMIQFSKSQLSKEVVNNLQDNLKR